MTWLPPEPDDAGAMRGARPWLPRGLASLAGGGEVTAELRYAVVDELGERRAIVVVGEWPVIDRDGRLRFPGRHESMAIGVDTRGFERFLGAHRLTVGAPRGARRQAELRARPLLAGDAFALRLLDPALLAAAGSDRGLGPDALRDPENWIEPPVYDVSIAARGAAKSAFYAAVTPMLDSAAARRLDPGEEP